MNKSSHCYKDILVSFLVISGVLSFMSGEFIISTALFCASSLFSTINLGGDAIPS
ncbi:hypothetical protein KEF85_00705 [Methylomonas paludis]|uniref:Uncharacterized protein n=1 Tax=Methylomonas paludis TaxID=1173101 RepID=A0A975MNU8_9GAMM|nr:hypothetical protein [Methylomonas paludis]QWF71055.1 hypothetical protein KEF85_00705 [Methylomonas paludis]